jgi:hypothetical protein
VNDPTDPRRATRDPAATGDVTGTGRGANRRTATRYTDATCAECARPIDGPAVLLITSASGRRRLVHRGCNDLGAAAATDSLGSPCLGCGRPLLAVLVRWWTAAEFSWARHYCTPACRREARNARRRAARRADPRPCARCGESFTPTRRDARFCRVACRVAHHRTKELTR